MLDQAVDDACQFVGGGGNAFRRAQPSFHPAREAPQGALAALQAGMGYTTLINRIVDIAWKRWEPTPFLQDLQTKRAERAKLRKLAAKAVQTCDPVPVKESLKELVEKPAEPQ